MLRLLAVSKRARVYVEYQTCLHWWLYQFTHFYSQGSWWYGCSCSSYATVQKQWSSSVCDYSPIAQSFYQLSVDARTRDRTKRKFDVAYLTKTEKLAFTKVAPILDLEEWHRVNLGAGYKMTKPTLRLLSLLVVIYKMPCKRSFLSTYLFVSSVSQEWNKGGCLGIIRKPVQDVEIANWKLKMVGFECDGASSNTAEGGLEGFWQEKFHGFFCFGVYLITLIFQLKMLCSPLLLAPSVMFFFVCITCTHIVNHQRSAVS